MAEAIALISFVSAVAALLDIGNTMVGRLNDFRGKVQDVPEAFKHIKAQLPITIDSLRRTQTEAQAGNVDLDTQKALTPALEGCHSQIRRLNDILDQVLPVDKDSSWTRKTKALRSVSKDKEVRSLLQELDRYLLRLVLHNTSGTSRELPQSPSVHQVSMIPAKRDLNFIDRPGIFEELQSNLTHHGRAALAGIGGVGKTQIVIEMCYRFLETDAEAHIFWAHAGTLTKFVQACKYIAENLRLPGWNDPKADVLQLVHHWLSSDQNGNWLFVLDNFDDVQLLDESLPSTVIQNTLYQYFPRVTNGVIIVTTRDRRVGERLAVRGKTTIVSTMAMTESVQLLRSYLTSSVNVAVHDLERLVEALDRLPLAITQAAAYITEQVITVEEYVSMLQNGDKDMQELLNESLSDDRRTDAESNSVIKTWKLSFDHITKQNPRAAQMLSLMAMFDRQGIPSTLFKQKDESERVFIQALAMLQDFSLITKAYTETYEMHRLVQLSTQAWLQVQNTTTTWRREALLVVAEKFPDGFVFNNWHDCETLLPHTRAVLQFGSLSNDASVDRAKLLQNLASFNFAQGRNEIALVEAKEAMETFERLWGSESPKTLSSMTTYAMCLEGRGEGQKALALLRRSSAAQEQMLGPGHHDTLRSMTRLAWNLYEQEELDEAEDLQRRILILREHSLGPVHPLVLSDMVSLTATLTSLGKFEEAEELCRRTLLTLEKALMTDHPSTLRARHNMARMLSRQSKYDEAIEQYRLVLPIRERVLGANHPQTLRSCRGLASCLYSQAKYDEAVQHYRVVLGSNEEGSSLEHDLITEQCRADYARCLLQLAQWEESIDQYQLVLSSRTFLEASDLDKILNIRHNLAWCFLNLKRYGEAIEQYRIVLAQRDSVSANSDSQRIKNAVELEEELAVRHNFAWCLSNSKRYDEAIEQYRIVLATKEKASAMPNAQGMKDILRVKDGLAFCLSQLTISRDGVTSAGKDKRI